MQRVKGKPCEFCGNDEFWQEQDFTLGDTLKRLQGERLRRCTYCGQEVKVIEEKRV
jgi:hypothetical protein